MTSVGSQSMVARLRRVIVKRPEEAFRSREQIEAEWKDLAYVRPPDLNQAAGDHSRFGHVALEDRHLRVQTGLRLLLEARELFREAGARNTAEAVQRAINSGQGAERNSYNRVVREEGQ